MGTNSWFYRNYMRSSVCEYVPEKSDALFYCRPHTSNGLIFLLFSWFFSTDIGGAYGTAKAGQGIMALGIRSPELLMKNIIPVVMAGVLGIYGLIVAVILNGKFSKPDASGYVTYSQYTAFSHLAAGLCC